MFQRWLDVDNEVALRPSLNHKRVRRFLRNQELGFGGDYGFCIHIVGKLDHVSLPVAVEYMRQDEQRRGHARGVWAQASLTTPLVWRPTSIYSSTYAPYPMQYLHEVLTYNSQRKDMDEATIRPLFPRRENVYQPLVGHALNLYDNGNYAATACETQRFYYIFEFWTS
jgi:hypothetical protein